MIDKTKPFYIVRTPEFGTGATYYTRPATPFNAERRYEVPELWRATQSRDDAIAKAMQAGARGKQFEVFELRLVGHTRPPEAVFVPAVKPRRTRKARKARRGK